MAESAWSFVRGGDRPSAIINENSALRRAERVIRPDGVQRHFYASVLLDAGESIKAVSEYLGHSDPGLTLKLYAHLMPSSRDRARKALGQALRPQGSGD